MKRNGSSRAIQAPASRIRILQRKLSTVLNAVYSPGNVAHGFVLRRNVLSNAIAHRNRYWVLRLDLEEFFPSINFGRVRGLFIAKPYGLPTKVATALAQLCCHHGQLPQGAPSSPIVSNMICARLDSELRRLAADHRCTITRYADDITFSSKIKDFPAALARRDLAPEGFITSLGPALVHVIHSNGFTVNGAKSRLLRYDQRQDVTGVIVNSKPNVPRRLRDQVRSMLHAWEKFGYQAAEEEWADEYDCKRRAGPQRPSFRRVVAGKLAYVKMIKGPDDPTYLLLSGRFRRLIGAPAIIDAIWVLEGPASAGTGFVLAGFGLVTCFHVIADGPVMAFQPAAPQVKRAVVVKHALPEIDLAICSLAPDENLHALQASGVPFETGQSVRVLGYPDWNPGHSLFDATGSITSTKFFFGAPYATVNVPTRRGNSGGPVLDSQGRVLGIVRTGSRWTGEADPDGVEHGVLCASCLTTVLGAGPNGERTGSAPPQPEA
jgi:S1-C subfamily serine protease